MKLLMITGALNAAIAIALGAFGAHGLKARVDAYYLEVWGTAAEYHLYHALALLVIGGLAKLFSASTLVTSGWVIAAGTLVFSGSLYLLVLTGQRWLGAITPIGGTALIIGWLIAVWALWKSV